MANQAFRVFMAILAVVLVDRASAFDPVKDQWGCKHNSGICVTSFKWCSRSKDYSKGCSIPENAYLYYNRDQGINAAMVIWDMKYNLTWQKTDPNYPVLIRWHFGEDPTAYSWTKNEHPPSWGVQETSFEFSFKELAEELPTNVYDADEVNGQAIKALSIFSISQPEKSSLMWGFSDQFSVIDGVAKPYMLTQRSDIPDEVTKQWKRGIGIEVGIGVLVLIVMAVAFWYLRKKGNERETAGSETRMEAHGRELTERNTVDERWAVDESARRAHVLYR
ncbi:hypothetical protein QQX98_011022 [Neonectria punicea]|uniref:Uncharacterized protein n=1 Tax=Neonectria punicea TaxID=979145 RepID=A0ABR1GN90_9HYPO